MDIKNEESLKRHLENGINIFAGAGFSTIPNIDGECLPLGKELLKEMEKEFGIENTLGYDLPEYSEICIRTVGKEKFSDFIRKRYTVKNYNNLYKNLLLIKMESFITTNVDNLIERIVDDSNEYYLHDVLAYGQSPDSGREIIKYVKLHGQVNDENFSPLFTRAEVALAGDTNNPYFDFLKVLLHQPTIFIGYSFNDLGVYKTILKTLNENHENIWMLFHEDDKKGIDYHRKLGFNVIVGTTMEFLEWVGKNFAHMKQLDKNAQSATLLEFRVPKSDDSTIVNISIIDYFRNANTNWYSVINNHPATTHYLQEAAEILLKKKKILAIGTNYCGKSTLAMQLAKKFEGNAIFISTLMTIEQADYIKKNLIPSDIIIVDDCSKNIVAFNRLAMSTVNMIIGFADYYTYETSRHLITQEKLELFDISDLNLQDIESIAKRIPPAILKKNYQIVQENHTMVDAMRLLVIDLLSHYKIIQLFDRIKNDDLEVFNFLCLIVYITCNKSVASMDLLFPLYHRDYHLIFDMAVRLNGYVKNIGYSLFENHLQEQNCYAIRSNIFAETCWDIMTRKYRNELAIVIKNFLSSANPILLPYYQVFVRTAFDAHRFKMIFDDNAHEVYEIVYKRFSLDEVQEAYTLQQWAQYLGLIGKYDEAFKLIDKSRSMSNKMRWSIENTYAVLLFESNMGKKDKQKALPQLNEAVGILGKCHESDKRKDVHAQKYAEFAVQLSQSFGIHDYLNQALEWMSEIQTINVKQKERNNNLIQKINLCIQRQKI